VARTCSAGVGRATRVLLSAAGVHVRHARVPALVCWALASLDASCGAALIAEGAPARLFYLLNVRRPHAAVTELACNALTRLCSLTPAHCDAVVTAQCARPVVAAATRAGIDGMDAAISALRFLRVVVANVSDAAVVLSAEDLDALCKLPAASEAIAERPDVVAALLDVIAAFAARSAANKHAARCSGAARTTEVVLALHAHHEVATIAAARLLSALD
jgi:hypothetical protein